MNNISDIHSYHSYHFSLSFFLNTYGKIPPALKYSSSTLVSRPARTVIYLPFEIFTTRSCLILISPLFNEIENVSAPVNP